jgi:predicted HicB family RNase H-like nuclease
MNGKYIFYKGFATAPYIDEEAGVIRGKVINTRDTITFHGATVAEAIHEFHESVDDYLDYCAKLGVAPEKPYSGQFIVRTAPETHRELAIISQIRGESLALVMRRAIKRELHRLNSDPSLSGKKAVLDSSSGVRTPKKSAKKTDKTIEHSPAKAKQTASRPVKV